MTIKKKPIKRKLDEIVRTINLDSIERVEGELVSREAPKERDINKSMIVQPVLNDAQLSIMLNKTPSWAIKTRTGSGGKQYTYVPHGYVTDTLNKAFGFDWDLILDPMSEGKMYTLEIEDIVDRNSGKVTKQNRHVAVCGHLTVRVHDKSGGLMATITKSGFGSQLWLPAMELGDALKGARSDLLKTCAYQFGIALDLYFNERAEISSFEEVQRAQVEKAEKEKQTALWEKQGLPTNFAVLLSKANSDYQISGDVIEKVLEMTLDEVMELDPSEIVEAWNEIVAFASSKKKV